MDKRNPYAPIQRAAAEARTGFAAAVAARLPEAAAAVYAEDARLLAPSAEVIQGRHAIESYWRAGLEAGVTEVQLEPTNLERRDGAAYEIGRYKLRIAPSGEDAVVDQGNYLLVHRPQPDGKWRWAIHTFNPDNPPAPSSI